jgi:hypothetical protein
MSTGGSKSASRATRRISSSHAAVRIGQASAAGMPFAARLYAGRLSP